MRISHRRKREHKAKVRRHAWKTKRTARVRRMCKEFDEGCAHAKYRSLATNYGQLCAETVMQQATHTMGVMLGMDAVPKSMIETAFLDGYDRVINDRRWDKQYKGTTLDREAAREADFAAWQREFFAHGGVIQLQPGEDVEFIQPGKQFIGIGPSRTGKGSLWQRAKAKVVGWFGGDSLQKQPL